MVIKVMASLQTCDVRCKHALTLAGTYANTHMVSGNSPSHLNHSTTEIKSKPEVVTGSDLNLLLTSCDWLMCAILCHQPH